MELNKGVLKTQMNVNTAIKDNNANVNHQASVVNSSKSVQILSTDDIVKDNVKASTGSILKRFRLFPGKENDPNHVNNNEIITISGSNKDTPIKKRVRILDPVGNVVKKEHYGTIESRYRNNIGTPHINNLAIEKRHYDHEFQSSAMSKFTEKAKYNIEQEEMMNLSVNLYKENIHCGEGYQCQDKSIEKVTNMEKLNDDENTQKEFGYGIGQSILINKPVRNRRRNRKNYEHWMLIRYQPNVFADAIRYLSPSQRQWVKNTGFGSLLLFRMKEYPQALSYYLALHYQAHCSSICFERTTIPVSDDDVNEILGIPKGQHAVSIMRSTHIEDLWRKQYTTPERLGWKVTANMVCDAIKKSNLADRMFKLNFLILFSNILFEGPTNPYVKQTMLGFAGDLDHCNEYNWCAYLISQMKVASIAWKENPETKYYTGSVPLLVYLYMDRVVKGKRQVRRKKPTYVGWSDSLILDRQMSDLSSNSLFLGEIALPLRYKDSDDESSYEDHTWNNIYEEYSDSEEEQGMNDKNIATSANIPKEVIDDEKNREDKLRSSGINNGNVLQKTSHLSEDTNIQVPRYVIDQLKESIDGYEKFQGKCFMYMLSVKEIFKNNSLVSALETRFIELIQKSNDFVDKELTSRWKNDDSANLCNSSIKDKDVQGEVHTNLSTGGVHLSKNTPAVLSKSLLDDDLFLSTEDLLYIDTCSIPKGTPKIDSNALFDSMESQSKSLSLTSGNNSSTFKTPSEESLFKVNLDAAIPNFNLGVEEDEECGRMNTYNPQPQRYAAAAIERGRRVKKIADIHRSPYVDRFTSIHGNKFKKEETDLWNWLHSNTNHPNRVLFKWGNIMCHKLEFQSMKDGEMIMTSPIDVWTCYLNSREHLRSPTSPRRFFCSIETTVGTLNAYNDKIIQKKYMLFEENMDHLLEYFGTSLRDLDMIFFPIHHVNHYYVVAYNLKNPCFEILDNVKSNKSVQELYGNQLTVLHKHFTRYLELKKCVRAVEIGKIIPQRLKMSWQTKDNGVDCGVFAMRHMETYYGGGVRTWDSKIHVESFTQKRQMSRLRLLFTYKMISCQINSVYCVILSEINDPGLLME